MRHGFEPVVRILDADHRWLDTKAVQFSQKLLCSRGAGAPWDVVAVGAGFVEVVHVDGDDAIFEDADGFDGIDARSDPVAVVRASSDAFAAAFAGLQHVFGIPIDG